MIKKIRSAALLTLSVVSLVSCTVSHTIYVTNNPVGSKTAEVKTKFFSSKDLVSFHDAMKKGRIATIGVAEYKLRASGRRKLVITGE